MKVVDKRFLIFLFLDCKLKVIKLIIKKNKHLLTSNFNFQYGSDVNFFQRDSVTEDSIP